MKITVNGEELILEKPSTISELIKIINCDITKVAIEKNAIIVPRSKYNEILLNEGDVMECVEFVGGG